MIRGTLLEWVLVFVITLAAAGPVPPPAFRAGTATTSPFADRPPPPATPPSAPASPRPPAAPAPPGGPATVEHAVALLIDEATAARAALLLPEGEADFAARFARDLPAPDLLAALLRPAHDDPFIDAYVRWQLTSFDPALPEFTDDNFARLMDAAPALVENPAAAPDVIAFFEDAEEQERLAPNDARHLAETWREIERRVAIAQAMNRPADSWRDWMESKLPASGPRPRQWLLERCAATVRAGWPPRLVKGQLTRASKASRADPSFTPEARQMVASQARRLEGLERRFVRDVTIAPDGRMDVRFSHARVTGRDVERWVAGLVGE